MIDYSDDLVNALEQILPVYLDGNVTEDVELPCISYKLSNDRQLIEGDTVGFSEIRYQLRLWAYTYSDLQRYAKQIDKTMKPLGFERTGSNDLFNVRDTIKQKILSYTGKYFEKYK